MNKFIISGIFGVLVLGGLIWIAQPKSKDGDVTVSGARNGSLVTEENAFDFGTISMAAGDVTKMFVMKNVGSESVTITKMYTSCMCTTASLMMDARTFGPYGMPGHGAIPTIGEALAPGEEARVQVVFDPAAHGPAGVGRIERVVAIENNAGDPVTFRFTAIVTP